MEKIKRSGLAKKTAVLLAFTLVFSGFTPVPIAGPLGRKTVLASESNAVLPTGSNAVGEIADGEIYGVGQPPGDPLVGEDQTDTITIYNNYAGEYKLDLSKHCPASWSNAALYRFEDIKFSENSYISNNGYFSITGSEVTVKTNKVQTLEIPENGAGQIPILISNTGHNNIFPIHVTVNIKVENPRINLLFDSTNFRIGDTNKITVTTVPEGYGVFKDTTLKWLSNNTNIATVDDSGNIRGVATGTATITCTDKIGIVGTLDITVTQASTPTPNSTNLSENNSSSGDSAASAVHMQQVQAAGVADVLYRGSITIFTQQQNKLSQNKSGDTIFRDANLKKLLSWLKENPDIGFMSDLSANAFTGQVANSKATKNTTAVFSDAIKLLASPDLSKFTGVSIKNATTGAVDTGNSGSTVINTDTSAVKSNTVVVINATFTTVAKTNFDTAHGSTIITFHTDFLDILQPGNYIIRLNYGEKYLDTEITINAPLKYDDGSVNSAYRAPVPETGGSFVGSGDSWMFKKADGTYALNEGICYNGRIYYIGKGGLMRTGLVMDESGAIYFLSTLHDGHYGAAVSGWAKDETGNTYFFDPENYKLVTGEKMIDGVNYTFADDGHQIS